MAKPVNPLDKFATYACHFELHAARTNAELRSQDSIVDERSTTRFNSVGTLLLNTRKDAHQVINNVKIEAISPGTSRTDVMEGIMSVSFDVHEPGSFAFIEKIKARMNELKIEDITSMLFGLKIVFVGRTPNNDIIITAKKVITMVIQDMTGSFTEKGGVYQLLFVPTAMAASTRTGTRGTHINFGFINRSIFFEANTVDEALIKLEDKINDVYKLEREKYVDIKDKRKINCKIVFDTADVSGAVVGMQSRSFAPTEIRAFTFSADKPIASYIMEIIRRTPALNEKIGAAKENLKKQFQEGIFYPMIIPSIEYNADEILVKYVLKFFKGGGTTGGGPYEFDYYFADVGKNVDVMSYDVKFVSIPAFLSTASKSSVDLHTNKAGQLTDSKHLKNSVHENVIQPRVYVEVERNTIEGKSGDIIPLTTRTWREEQGFNSFPWDKVAGVKLSSDSIASFLTAIDNLQTTIEIRGHEKLLDLCLGGEGDSINDLIWLKINIYMNDGGLGGSVQKRQFYYTGYYRILSITNIFADNGQFIQQVSLTANETVSSGQTNTSAPTSTRITGSQ